MRLFVPIMLASILLMGAVGSEYFKILFGDFGRDRAEEQAEDETLGPFDTTYKKPAAVVGSQDHLPKLRFTNGNAYIPSRDGQRMRGPIDFTKVPSKGRKRRSYKNPYTK